jgi:hypothetical protein
MSRSWTTLSQLSNSVYTPQQFEEAAYRLVTEQVLYSTDRSARVAYALVESYFSDFASVLAPLGVRLERNAHHRYIVALPNHGAGTLVTLADTLLTLVLRQRYDEGMRQGRVQDDGEVLVDLEELREAYKGLTGRDLDTGNSLRNQLITLKRWGVARMEDTPPDDPQPFAVCIRPAIVDIVGEQWLQRLAQHGVDDGETEGEVDATA